MQIVLAALLMVASTQFNTKPQKKTLRQPYPETGFWVTENMPGKSGTIVRYYANSNHLVSTVTEPANLDITKVSVRRYLNKKLASELSRDSTKASILKLYEIN
ncbi:hypothetical protein LXM25_22985 [Dyadobacter sp. LJ53]|uniref:hypothetical protein n=1 Tax=Dyadobacter chenwenxiniae TaxID=2906456 RepID=UPI001F3B9038|nr:hypothetical protein [Dyadobacter chenwenxiniae]MCF0052952.1 hypothetical protein [Dyadobacter chenwenxiniae]